MRTRGVALQVTPDASQREHGNTVGDREKAGGPLGRPPFVGRPVLPRKGMLGERGRLPPTNSYCSRRPQSTQDQPPLATFESQRFLRRAPSISSEPTSIGLAPGPSKLSRLKLPISFNEAEEIADGCQPFNVIVRKLDTEVIFHHYHQFEAIKPVSSEIIEEVCFVRDLFSVYSQMLGNENSDVRGNAFVPDRCWLREAADAHDPVLRIAARLPQHLSRQSVPNRVHIRKFSQRCINDTPARTATSDSASSNALPLGHMPRKDQG
jgi:hypothetical protein